MLNKYFFVITIEFFYAMGLSNPAFAEKQVFAPDAEQGEWELENTGVYDIDSAKNKNAVQEYHEAVGYGVNSFWHTELELEDETQPTADAITPFQVPHMEWENIFQLAPKGEYWLDPGVYLAYEAPLINKQVGQFEGKVLLEKNFQRVSNILNVSFNKEVGGGADPRIPMAVYRGALDTAYPNILSQVSNIGMTLVQLPTS